MIHRLIEGVATTPGQRESGLRIVPGAFVTELGMPAFGSTMMIVSDEELESSQMSTVTPSSSAPTARGVPSADETTKVYGFAPVSEGLPTARVMPPSSSTPEPPPPVKKTLETDTGEFSSRDRQRRRKNG